MLLQDMWRAAVDWDDPLGEDIENRAWQWLQELSTLSEIEVPRCIRLGQEEDMTSMILHTFVDASLEAYGSVVYAVCMYSSGCKSSRIIAAKGHVAPLEEISIPRLELMAAILGLRLAESTCQVLDISLHDAVFWSDSMNVLWWIRGHSRQFKPFVANRVGEIQRMTMPVQWRHVPTAENPADIITRGVTASQLVAKQSWCAGPEFLIHEECDWPDRFLEKVSTSQGEMKQRHLKEAECVTMHSAISVDENWSLNPERFSDWVKLVRRQACVRRFLHNCRLPKAERKFSDLQVEEIEDAEIQIISNMQKLVFSEEYTALKKNKVLSNNSKLLALNPQLDDDGLMRSNGRLKHADYLSSAERFPIILPRNL